MKYYVITNTASGHCFGTYRARDERDALDVLARDAGYADHEDACRVAGKESALRATEAEVYALSTVSADKDSITVVAESPLHRFERVYRWSHEEGFSFDYESETDAPPKSLSDEMDTQASFGEAGVPCRALMHERSRIGGEGTMRRAVILRGQDALDA